MTIPGVCVKSSRREKTSSARILGRYQLLVKLRGPFEAN